MALFKRKNEPAPRTQLGKSEAASQGCRHGAGERVRDGWGELGGRRVPRWWCTVCCEFFLSLDE